MQIDENITIDTVVGLNDAKEILTTRLHAFFKYRNQLKGASRGILLYGYPGTAKTMLSIAVLNTLDKAKVLCRIATPDELTDHVGTTSKKVREFFLGLQRVAQGKDIVLVLDEADETLTVKGERSVIANERVSAILRELDGMERNNENVYIIATTNHPMKIEPAMLRSGRIDCHIKTELPTNEERETLLKMYVNDIPGCSKYLNGILKFTYKWTGADYNNLGNELKLKYLLKTEKEPVCELSEDEIINILNRINKYRKMNFAKFEQEYKNLTSESETEFSEIYKIPKGQTSLSV